MKIVFMGTPRAAVPSLERILQDGHEMVAVWTQPDKPAGRGNKLTASPVKEFALQNNLQVFQSGKIKNAEALAQLQSHKADVLIVVAYGRILPETFLHAFPKGAINVHFSLLPKYRGAAPVNWAIANGEEKTGVSTMKMDAGLDTGEILLQRETDISDEETGVELMPKLALLGADLLSETLAMYDELTPQPQDNSQATIAPMLKKEDGRINWHLTAQEIVNRVRGFQPFPTSFTNFRGKKMTIWKGENQWSVVGGQWSAVGTILQAKGDEFVISCGSQTTLKILELQIEGKRKMFVKDFLNGVKIETGEKLG